MPHSRPAFVPTCTSIVLAALAAGCGSGHAGAEKRLHALREELTMTQAALDRVEERLMALELADKVERGSSPAPVEQVRSSRPPLKVVRVEPELAAAHAAEPRAEAEQPVAQADPVATSPEQDAERPLIQGEGDDLQSSLDPPRAKKSRSGHTRRRREAPLQPR